MGSTPRLAIHLNEETRLGRETLKKKVTIRSTSSRSRSRRCKSKVATRKIGPLSKEVKTLAPGEARTLDLRISLSVLTYKYDALTDCATGAYLLDVALASLIVNDGQV